MATTTIFIAFTAGNLRSHSLHTVTQRKSKAFFRNLIDLASFEENAKNITFMYNFTGGGASHFTGGVIALPWLRHWYHVQSAQKYELTSDHGLLYNAHCLVSSPLYSSLWCDQSSLLWCDSMFQYDDTISASAIEQNNRNSTVRVHARAAFSTSLVGHLSACNLRL